VRAAVRAELAAAAASDTGPCAHPEHAADGDEVEAAAGPADALALPRARQVLEGAMADGTWSDADRLELRRALSGLDRAGREEIFATLFPAINRGDLALATTGAPL
jgi:hypothetical protein